MNTYPIRDEIMRSFDLSRWAVEIDEYGYICLPWPAIKLAIQELRKPIIRVVAMHQMTEQRMANINADIEADPIR